MKIIMLGAPGAGKGTQAKMIADKYGVPHISTGDIFRANIKNGTELGMEAKKYMDQGLLVPDELTVRILLDRVAQDDCKNGYVLDGFPRTIPQAEAIRVVGVPLDFVVEIEVNDAEIAERMSGRRVHLASGRSYHVKFNPPKVEGLDDVTGEPLIQRDDDLRETVLKRLEVYHSQTKPLVAYYSAWAANGEPNAPQYRKIAGVGKVEEIRDRAFDALK